MTYVSSRRRRMKFPSFEFELDFGNWNKQKIALYAVIGLIGLVVLGYLCALILFAWYSRDLPSPGKLSESSENATVFYDRNGKVLYSMYKDKNRVPTEFKDISKYAKEATVAVEDKRFYTHNGISEFGILRAFFNSLLGRPQGGSTITQQLVKNTILTSEHSLGRKIREAVLAIEVEKRYTKDEILGMYLNEAPYGGTLWGIGAASRGYFGKEPKDLNLVESAILAGLPQSPTYYSPFIGKNDAWRDRAKDVLRNMEENGYITKQQHEDALKQLAQVKFTAPKLSIEAPQFVFYVRNLIEKEFGAGILEQGLRVKTTLSLDIQQQAEKIVKDEIEGLKTYHVDNGALLALDSQNGDIIAYVGSHDFTDENNGAFDIVSQANRQPGSSLKPIVYATAFEKGYTPASILMDVKTTFADQGGKDYTPLNYDGKFRGPVQIRFALGNSLNIPAVKMLAMVGLRDFLQKAYDMGLNSMAPTQKNIANLGLSASLGGGGTTLMDLTSAYSVFAHNGNKIEMQSIEEITDGKGKVIYKKKAVKEKKVVSPEVAYLISHILSDNNARMDTFGASSSLNIRGKTVGVKTGTTDDKRDNWAVGFTKGVTLGVWVGNNDNSPMNPKIASGVTGASPIWNKAMTMLLKKYPDGIMDKPEKVKAVEIDSYLGGLPKDGSSKRTEYFIEGTEPKDISPFYKKLKISKSNGKIANDVEVKNGNYEEKDFIVITESDPISTDGKNRWQEAIDAWSREQKDDKYHYPTETSDSSSDGVVVSIKSPSDKSTVTTHDVQIKAHITSVEHIKRVKIWVNGNETRSLDGDRQDIDETINLPDGTYEIKMQAWNEKDKSSDAFVKIGVNKAWDASSSSPTNTPTPTP